VTTDKAGPYLKVLDELVPAVAHVTEQYANNRIEADRFRSAAQVAGHAFVPNLRRGHSAPDQAGPARARYQEGVGRLHVSKACFIRHCREQSCRSTGGS